MKKHVTLGVMVVATLLTGCCSSPHTGSASGHEQEFRQKLEASIPVQKWQYRIDEIRFSNHREKALVIFETPAGERQEVVFTEDSFHRYEGKVYDYSKKNASGGVPITASERVIIVYPSK